MKHLGIGVGYSVSTQLSKKFGQRCVRSFTVQSVYIGQDTAVGRTQSGIEQEYLA